jgi:hypothetical protein
MSGTSLNSLIYFNHSGGDDNDFIPSTDILSMAWLENELNVMDTPVEVQWYGRHNSALMDCPTLNHGLQCQQVQSMDNGATPRHHRQQTTGNISYLNLCGTFFYLFYMRLKYTSEYYSSIYYRILGEWFSGRQWKVSASNTAATHPSGTGRLYRL